MTINFLTDPLLAGRRDDTDLTNYPYATFKDRTSTLSNNGTPLTYAKTWKDFDGFRQRIIGAGKITPNGNADTGVSSQIFDGLMGMYGETMYFYSLLADDTTKEQLSHSLIGSGAVANVQESGAGYQLYSALNNGGVEFGATPGKQIGDSTTVFRVGTFDITHWGDTWSKDGNRLHYNVEEFVTLTGIPQTAEIYGCWLKVFCQSGQEYTCSVTPGVLRGTGSWLRLENFALIIPDGSEIINYSADPELTIYYNPTGVD